jgi:AAA+ ATPase superfamily predicted ATPase
MFIGRASELKQLKRLTKKRTASLVCILGRRRIGKSTLIEEFAKTFPKFIEIQGLGPDEGSGEREQLDNFAKKLSEQTRSKLLRLDSWSDAFTELASYVKRGPALVLLDEISWMARGDPLFAAKLKVAWDTQFKKNPNLILVLCGSVSSWISDNLLKNANFEGRISLQLQLKELSLVEINQFWESNNFHLSDLERLLLLSITGGVPKYLEEVVESQGAENNILEICYNPAGILYNDFEKIFLQIFGRRTKSLERIVRACLMQKLSPAKLAQKLKISLSGDLSEDLEILELSGFLSRDYFFNLDGSASKLNHLRVSDNYLRFYLKYIEPQKKRIAKGGKIFSSLSELPGFYSLLGLQFENLILANRMLLYPHLGLTNSQIVTAAPYVQSKKTTNQGACQVDLLIHTELDVFFLCEMKCKKKIGLEVIAEIKRKMKILKFPKKAVLKPVLIYSGELVENYEDEFRSFFYRTINLKDLFQTNGADR